MTRVLLVGYDPESVDFSNPALPPGMSVEKIRASIALALKQMTDRGWEADVCYIRPDGTARQAVEHHLASAKYDCIVIGAGVRLPPQRLADFEEL
jgi:protein-L-isoaspartate O-methyltransferase